MKKFLRIWALSLALIVSLLLLRDVTNAAGWAGSLVLRINTNSTGSTCVYGTSLDLGQQTASYNALVFSGMFTSPAAFYCDDQVGLANWAMTMQATNLTNATAQTIASGLIQLKTSPSFVVNGTCTASAGTTTYTPISNPGVIVSKTAALGQICRIQATGVRLKVDVPANQAVGVYTGTLTVNVPF